MTAIWLRIGRRPRSLWEANSTTEDIVRLAFSNPRSDEPDLSLSLYLIEPSQADQARAEHLASLLNPPVNENHSDLDLAELGEIVCSPGATKFDFTRKVHAELKLPDRNALVAMVEAVRNSSKRMIPRMRGAILGYMTSRFRAGDPEWIAVLSTTSKWTKLVSEDASATTKP